MKRCKPLLGTYVEISCADGNENGLAVDAAFSAMETVQSLMGFIILIASSLALIIRHISSS